MKIVCAGGQKFGNESGISIFFPDRGVLPRGNSKIYGPRFTSNSVERWKNLRKKYSLGTNLRNSYETTSVPWIMFGDLISTIIRISDWQPESLSLLLAKHLWNPVTRSSIYYSEGEFFDVESETPLTWSEQASFKDKIKKLNFHLALWGLVSLKLPHIFLFFFFFGQL